MPTFIEKFTNPLAMLTADHAYVKEMFTKCLQAESRMARRLLAQEICDNLKIHAALEEEIFYPTLRELGGQEGRQFVSQAIEEHQDIKDHIETVMHTDTENGEFQRYIEALQERVIRHAEKEEDIFPLAEERLPLGELAARMDMRRLQLLGTVRPPSGLAIMGIVMMAIGAFLFLKRRR